MPNICEICHLENPNNTPYDCIGCNKKDKYDEYICAACRLECPNITAYDCRGCPNR